MWELNPRAKTITWDTILPQVEDHMGVGGIGGYRNKTAGDELVTRKTGNLLVLRNSRRQEADGKETSEGAV